MLDIQIRQAVLDPILLEPGICPARQSAIRGDPQSTLTILGNTLHAARREAVSTGICPEGLAIATTEAHMQAMVLPRKVSLAETERPLVATELPDPVPAWGEVLIQIAAFVRTSPSRLVLIS